MIKAAEEAIVGATGGGTKIGESANNGAAADADSVKKIAKGMKGIVDAAGTAAGKKEDALKDVQDAGDADAAAGKLFGTAAGGGGAGDADIKKAAEAVSSVSGEQILKAIVDAAGGGEQDGAAPNVARNPIAAAIGNGAAGADFGNDMKKKDKVAAALVLRGLAKGGKFSANANDANVKSAVENAVGKKDGALKDVQDAGDADAETGKLFGTAAGGNDAGADDIKKAAEAVSSVSGEQILKAIVDAAGGGEQVGQAPGAARNPIAAAIGAAGGAGANFHNDMKKKDKVAAALVLRGLAKNGKFSAAAAAEAGKLFGASGGAGADDNDIKKAASAVSSVSGKQILILQ
ncbi:variable large family protein [Borreliella burgdorferi]|uniref:variable large family protein n=1 Tax=Borreliella burgdorferi TaxID=139 RepID=UPI001304F0FA|nr:variable large family protein [Borreliella burgdorferi]